MSSASRGSRQGSRLEKLHRSTGHLTGQARRRILLIQEMVDAAGPALLHASCDVTTLRDPDDAAISEAIVGHHAAIVRSPSRLSAANLDAGTELEMVSAAGAGTDAVDVSRATELGLPVLYAPGVGAPSVVEFTLGALVMAARRIGFLHAECHRPDLDWSRRLGDLTGFELRDRVLGIVGLGHIGREVARRAVAAFDVEVIGFDPNVSAEDGPTDVELVDSLDEVLARADVVSIHVGLNDQTRGFIGAEQLAFMKPGAFVVNTSRGHLIDDAALADALRSGQVGGAVLDCLTAEPHPASSPLAGIPNALLTPHVAGLTDRSMSDLAKVVASNLLAALDGARPPYLANPEVWERRRPSPVAGDL